METLLVQADAAKAAAKEVEEHLELAYTGLQVNFVMAPCRDGNNVDSTSFNSTSEIFAGHPGLRWCKHRGQFNFYVR